MKPEQFIHEFGVKKARDVVEGAPDWAKGYYEPTGQYQDQEWSDEMSVDLSELNRLVESVDQINAFDGGIKESKEILSRINKNGSKYATLFERPALEQAIRDHESIYGGVENA